MAPSRGCPPQTRRAARGAGLKLLRRASVLAASRKDHATVCANLATGLALNGELDQAARLLRTAKAGGGHEVIVRFAERTLRAAQEEAPQEENSCSRPDKVRR